MTQQDDPRYPPDTDTPPDAATLDYQSPASAEQEGEPSAVWFGYIGFGIVIVAMLAGLVAMVAAVFYFIGWTQG